MKVVINEKQLETILNELLSEQDVDSGENSTSYPEVNKWESGVTRGPGNQIGNTKWSDSVKIERGKANQLK